MEWKVHYFDRRAGQDRVSRSHSTSEGALRNACETWMFATKSTRTYAIEPAALDEYVRIFSAPGVARAGFAWHRAAFSPEGLAQAKVRAAQRLPMPVLALGGSDGVGDALRATVAALGGATTNLKLTFHLDHSAGLITFLRPSRNAAIRSANWLGDAALRNPTTGIACCCARAASGHAAPPSSVPARARGNRRARGAPAAACPLIVSSI
jgi:hypothetical protein